MKKEALYHSWLVVVIFVLAVNYVLFNTSFGISILPDEPNFVVIGSILDLAVVAPLMFLAWMRKWSWKNIILSMAAGLVLVRFLIPMKYLTPFEKITWVGFAVEAVFILLEIFILLTIFKNMPTIIRSVRESELPVVFSFSAAVREQAREHPIVKVLLAEMLVCYYAFASWRKKPAIGANDFTLHHNSSFTAFRVMLIHALVLETIAIHWMLYEKYFLLAMILLVVDVYTVIFFLADMQAVRLNPLKVTNEGLYISFGIMKRIEMKWSDIEEIIEDNEMLQKKRSKDTINFIARDFEVTHPTVILKLKSPVEATLLMGLSRRYEKVAIKVDNPAPFKGVLRDKLHIGAIFSMK